jgi:hypothetical protein
MFRHFRHTCTSAHHQFPTSRFHFEPVGFDNKEIKSNIPRRTSSGRMPIAIRPTLRQSVVVAASQDIGQKTYVDIVQLVHSKSRYVHRSFRSATRRIGSYPSACFDDPGCQDMMVSKGRGMPGRPEECEDGGALEHGYQDICQFIDQCENFT